MITVDQQLQWLQEMISCNHQIYMWTRSADYRLIHSNCPHREVLNTIFMMDYPAEALDECSRLFHVPYVLPSSIGMLWIADFETGGSDSRLHVMGPAFVDEVTVSNLQSYLDKRNVPISIKAEFIRILKTLPVVSLSRLLEYGTMFHYCITGCKIHTSDISFHRPEQSVSQLSGTSKEQVLRIDHRTTYIQEQRMLKLIEEGNLDYKKDSSSFTASTYIGSLGNGDTFRQVKNLMIASITLCTRAAIKGGLSPDTAYTLGDHYITCVEACGTPTEVLELNNIMRDDFIKRVHMCKELQGISKPIQDCCDYIRLHIDTGIKLEELANRAGYSPYYFTKKFKSEMNITIQQYIREQKLEMARNILLTTNKPVKDIAEELGYSTVSHFIETFRKETGISPAAFRQQGI